MTAGRAQRTEGREQGSISLSLFPLFSLLLIFSVLSGCTAFQLGAPLRIQPDDWTTEGGSPARDNATGLALRPPLDEAWQVDADGAFGPAAALVADGVLVVVTRKGEVRGYDIETGRKRAVVDFREPVEGAAVLTRTMFYAPVAAGKRTLIGYDFVKGQRRWALRAGPHEAGLLLAGDALVAAGMDGTVRGIDPADGTVRWNVTPDSAAGFYATPTLLAPGLVAVADDRGRVTALDLDTGTERWTHAVGAPVYETLAASAGLLFVPTTRGRFVALDADSGEAVWEAEVGDEVKLSAPAVGDGLVVVGASDGRLRALGAASGEERWSFRADGNFAAAPLLTPEVVYAGSLDAHLYALDRATGEMLWEEELGGRITSAPVLHDGTLIVLAEPRHIHAFRPGPVAAEREDL